MLVLTAQPRSSAPPRPSSETRNSDSPTTSARTSSLILGAAVALLRMAVARRWFTLMNWACPDNYKVCTPKGSHYSVIQFEFVRVGSSRRDDRAAFSGPMKRLSLWWMDCRPLDADGDA